MAIVRNTVPFGEAVPPAGPHTITTNLPGWDTAIKVREGDMSPILRTKSLYHRFMPFGPTRDLAFGLATKLGLPPPEYNVLLWTDPSMLDEAVAYATSKHRKNARLSSATKLVFKAVSVANINLYLIFFLANLTPSVLGAWQKPGKGVSTRLAEFLLPELETMKELEVSVSVTGILDPFCPVQREVAKISAPAPTFLPETEAHTKLRERIQGLLTRGVNGRELEAAQKVKGEDIFLFPTGMAAIWTAHSILLKHRPGMVVALGAVFHDSWNVFEEASTGFKHFKDVNTPGFVEDFETWMEGEKEAGRDIGYVFVEFPSNPIGDCVDLEGLSKVCEKHSTPLLVDDTVSSFASVGVLTPSTMLISSLTKSFSGYADVMAGSLILNPLSPLYPTLAPLYRVGIQNEFFSAEAEKLLSNSEDFLERTVVLNRNAKAIAEYLHSQVTPSGPVTRVYYPSLNPGAANYLRYMRKPTDAYPAGYGCLLSVDLATEKQTIVFYESLSEYFYPGPHLGAHRTLALCYNALVYGKDKEEREYHGSYGLSQNQIRISAGLEETADLVKVVEMALAKAKNAMENGEQ